MTSKVFWPHWLTKSILIELALFFVLALMFDNYFGAGDRFASISPHPFWIPVLLFSVYYGTGPGLLAAAVATLALLFGNFPTIEADQDLYQYYSSVAVAPLLWGVAAVLLGELSARRLTERESAQRDLATIKEETRGNERLLKEFKRQIEKLELRLAADSKTLRLALQRMEGIQHADIQSILDNVAPLVRDLHNAPQCSIFFVQNNALEAVMASGWEEKGRLQSRFEPGSPLYEAVIEQGRSLCLVNPSDREALADQGAMVEPLVDQRTGTVFGMIKIGGLSFVELNHDTEVMFRILAEIIAAALMRAAHVDAVQEKASDTTQIMVQPSSRENIAWLLKLGERAGFQSSFVVFRLVDEDVPQDVVRTFQSVIATAASQELRATDKAFELNQSRLVSVVALPLSDINHGLLVARKLKQSLQKLMPDDIRHLSFRMSVSRGLE